MENAAVKFAPWSGWHHGELSHVIASAHGGSDDAANTEWAVGRVIEQSATPARSSLLSADEAQSWRGSRVTGPTASWCSTVDVDFLLDVITG